MTFDDVRKLELGTKVRCAHWHKKCAVFLNRASDGQIYIFDWFLGGIINHVDFDSPLSKRMFLDLLYHDNIELFEEQTE